MKKNFLLKLAKMVMKFAEIETDKGALIYEGELAKGTEVFVEIEGELVPAEDGEYKFENKTITVTEGKVEKIVEEEVEENIEPEDIKQEEEPVEDEKPIEEDVEALKARITELEAIIAERDARIAELEALLVEKEEQLAMSVAKPAHKEVKDLVITNKENKALKYFN